jgi:hypothetical protein
MRILSLIIALPTLMVMILPTRQDDSPHGEDFTISCSKCHSANGWEFDRDVFSFDHSSTALPLTGQHKGVDCRLCHPTLVFSEAPSECAHCHTDMHEQTVGNDCRRCHTPHSWIVTNITDIHRQGRFPLLGAHFMAECATCHPSASMLRYEPIGIECSDCHMADYQAAKDPDHVAGNLSLECTDCHSMTSYTWGSGGFNHQFFPLTGGHNIQDCSQCHTPGDFTNTPTDCYTCHQADYLSTLNPNHSSAGFSTECLTCHSTAPGWSPATFDHTFFPLTLGHASVGCEQCHDPSDYANISTDCYLCHQEDFSGTTDPDHQAGLFPVNCLECHTTNPGWTPAAFDHNSFPLTNGHSNVSCAQCHDPSDYSNVSTDCYSCHEQDYMNTTNPGHVAASISIDCMECHTTMPGWKPATFDHNSFPLTNGHSNVSCAQCHDPSDYSNVSTDCYSCHEQDYMNTTNPGHVAASISIDCMECHTTMPGWKPAEFPIHDAQFFPIYSGSHRGEWNSCSQCHEDLNNYASFTCLTCHEHSQSRMDDKHSGESGYTYNSIACLECHPRGSGD